MRQKVVKAVSLLLVLVMVFALGACTAKEQQDAIQNLANYAQEQLDAAKENVTVEDTQETETQPVPEETQEPEPTQEAEPEESAASATKPDGYIYTSTLYGFTIVMPADWEEKCEIVEEDMCVYFYSRANRFISYGDVEFEAGRLFYITVPEEDMKQDNGDYYYPSYQIIGQYQGADVVVVFPTDVQCDIEDEAKTKEYTQMYEQVPKVLETITFG